MVIVAFDHLAGLLEADVIEPGKRSAAYILNRMVRHQKVLLPPHKHVVRFGQRLVIKGV